MRRMVVALAVAAMPLCTSRAAAQVEIAPFFGTFWPLGAGWSQDVGLAQQVERRHIGALMAGARLAFWTSTRLGVEATVGFSPSQVAVSGPGRIQDITAGVMLSSVRVLARLATLTDGNPGSGVAHWDFNAGIGVGVIARRGSAWANITGTTHPAAVLNLETRTPLAGDVTMRVGVEDFVSWATFDRGLPSETRSRVQHDIILTLAAQIRLGGGTAR